MKPSWDAWLMTQAFIVSQRSIDPATKCGCVAVNEDHEMLSSGYNGPVNGMDDTKIPLTRPEKYDFFEHSESNCINTAAKEGVSLKNSSFYVTGYPCTPCFRKLLRVRAKKIIYFPIMPKISEDQSAIEKMKRYSDVKIEEYSDYEAIFKILHDTENYIKAKLGIPQ